MVILIIVKLNSLFLVFLDRWFHLSSKLGKSPFDTLKQALSSDFQPHTTKLGNQDPLTIQTVRNTPLGRLKAVSYADAASGTHISALSPQ